MYRGGPNLPKKQRNFTIFSLNNFSANITGFADIAEFFWDILQISLWTSWITSFPWLNNSNLPYSTCIWSSFYAFWLLALMPSECCVGALQKKRNWAFKITKFFWKKLSAILPPLCIAVIYEFNLIDYF